MRSWTIHLRRRWKPRYVFCIVYQASNSRSIDITEFLRDEITGPASFSCKTNEGCKFEEPGMNGLIEMFFGDGYITLQCDSGECLHYSQVPGYVVRPQLDRSLTQMFMSIIVGTPKARHYPICGPQCCRARSSRHRRIRRLVVCQSNALQRLRWHPSTGVGDCQADDRTCSRCSTLL